MKRILVLFSALSLAACSTLRVSSDHDPGADFSRYKTFAWSPNDQQPSVDLSGAPSDLVEDRIRGAVDRQLEAKGLRKAGTGETPDLYVANHVRQKEKVDVSSTTAGFGLGFRHGFWGSGFGIPITSARQYTEGTLVIDLIDAKTNKLAWRGIASDAVHDQDDLSAEKINEVVAETMKKYPPGRSSS